MQPYTAGFAKERCSGGVKEGRKDEGKNDGLSRREGRNGCKRTAEGEGKYRKWQLGKKIRRWSVKERQMTNDSAMCKHTAKDVAFQFILLKLTREFFKPPVSLSKCALLN